MTAVEFWHEFEAKKSRFVIMNFDTNLGPKSQDLWLGPKSQDLWLGPISQDLWLWCMYGVEQSLEDMCTDLVLMSYEPQYMKINGK